MKKRYSLAVLAVAVAALEYGWDLWYMGGLYRSDGLLALSSLTAQTLGQTLLQHGVELLPALAMMAVAALRMRGRFPEAMGFRIAVWRGRIATAAVGAVYLLLLAAGLLWSGHSALVVCYQWFYYLVVISLGEEAVFRGLLPHLMERSGLPAWCAWIVPGLLFGWMHTLLPVIQMGFTAGVLRILLTSIGGYVAMACAFYALRRWSGTLWLPVLLHAAMDFTGVFR